MPKKHTVTVFENRVVRKILEPKGNEVTGDWSGLRNEELHDLFFSPNTIRVIKSEGMRWARLVARMGERRVTYGA